jgi:large subunit ribosomal protein L28
MPVPLTLKASPATLCHPNNPTRESMFRPMIQRFHSSLQRAGGITHHHHRPRSSGAAAAPPVRCLSSVAISSGLPATPPPGTSSHHSARWSHPLVPQHPIQSPTTQVLLQVRHRSNRSKRGLYDGRDIRSGNNVSFSMKATKRTFKPNVFLKRVYSSVLDSMIPFHLTTSTLRSIDKAGGLDHYLLTNPTIVEGEGLAIKRKILRRLKNRQRMARKEEETTDSVERSATASET